MEDFGLGFDEDLFGDDEKSSKATQADSAAAHWAPPLHVPGWFAQHSDAVGKDANLVKLFHASHLYYTKRYKEAIEVFTDILESVPASNHQLCRDVTEGLARSFMKSGNIKQALITADRFETHCKSKLHAALYHSLCAEIYSAGQDSSSELEHLQLAVMAHRANADLWLRLAECYGRSSGIEIFHVPDSLKFSDAKIPISTWYAFACLIRADVILRSVSGKEEHLRKRKCSKLRDRLVPIIGRLPEAFVTRAREALGKDMFNLEQQPKENEFVDLGSSAQAVKTEEEDDEETPSKDPGDGFENHWFQFITGAVELYCTTSSNTNET